MSSLRGSMPWLISSTTRDGACALPCSGRRKKAVAIVREPLDCRDAVRRMRGPLVYGHVSELISEDAMKDRNEERGEGGGGDNYL